MAQSCSSIIHFHLNHVGGDVCEYSFYDQANRARFNGGGGIIVTVRLKTGNANEQITRLNPSRIECHSRYLDLVESGFSAFGLYYLVRPYSFTFQKVRQLQFPVPPCEKLCLFRESFNLSGCKIELCSKNENPPKS